MWASPAQLPELSLVSFLHTAEWPAAAGDAEALGQAQWCELGQSLASSSVGRPPLSSNGSWVL